MHCSRKAHLPRPSEAGKFQKFAELEKENRGSFMFLMSWQEEKHRLSLKH